MGLETIEGEFVTYLLTRTYAVYGIAAPTETAIIETLANLLEPRYNVDREWIHPEVALYQDLGLE